METSKTTGKPAEVKPAGQKPEPKTEIAAGIASEKPKKTKEKAADLADEFAKAAKAKEEKDAAFIVPYAKAYPKEKAFYVTSDKQVFLEKDRGLAVMHQNSLGNGEKVQTIKVTGRNH